MLTSAERQDGFVVHTRHTEENIQMKESAIKAEETEFLGFGIAMIKIPSIYYISFKIFVLPNLSFGGCVSFLSCCCN